MTKTPSEYLETILNRNPGLSIENRRDVEEEVFVELGRALIEEAEEVYLTSHTPNECRNTSYRLWIGKPEISGSGHPDWCNNINLAVVEMWKHRGYDRDREIFLRITRNYPSAASTEVIRNEDKTSRTMLRLFNFAPFCSESRIYKVK